MRTKPGVGSSAAKNPPPSFAFPKQVVLTASVSDRGIDAFPRNGVFDKVFNNPGVVQITAPPTGDLSSEERTAIEFPLAGISNGAVVSKVALLLTPQGGPNGNLGLAAGEAGDILGYAGDGAITVADMTAGTLVGTIVGPTASGVITVPIDKTFIATLLTSGATHAGLMFKGSAGAAGPVTFSFAGTFSGIPAEQRPRLRVLYY